MKQIIASMALAAIAMMASAPAMAESLAPLPPPVAIDGIWQPKPHLRWQVQYATRPIDLTVDADVYKIDLFDNSARAVAAIKKKGKKVVCYLNAGAWEDWRPDAKHFPDEVMGKHYEGWPGERWLDVRRIDLLAPVMLARLDLCKAKGFHGVLLDNVDGHTNQTGFPLESADQLRFNVWMASEARKRGLAVGINNDPGHASTLLPYFDWVQAESCFSQGWCARLSPFVEAGKPVVVLEYTDDPDAQKTMCRQASDLRFTLMIKKRELDSFRTDCRIFGRQTARGIQFF